jgi:hypothetical protein
MSSGAPGEPGFIPAPQPAEPPRFSRLWAVPLALAVGWAALFVLRFWQTNPVFWGPGPAGKYGVLSGFLGPWTFSLENSPPLQLAQALVAVALCQATGTGIVRGARVYLPFWERHALAFALGLFANGLVAVHLAMFHLLNTYTVTLGWHGAVVLAWLWARRRAAAAPDFCWGAALPAGDGTPPLWSERDARAYFEQSTDPPEGTVPSILTTLGWLAVIAITALTFHHAVFYPETYWDSLILYIGYSRMTFLEGGFPFKAEAQVGIGLGANYPHLFEAWGAGAAALWNRWTDLPHRLVAPCCGLAATLMISGAIRLAFRSALAAMAGALLFRLTPQSIAYTTWASNYSVAIMAAAACALLVAYLARTRAPAAFALLCATCAAAMHINFLMLTLWGPAVSGAMLALRRTATPQAEAMPFVEGAGDDHQRLVPPGLPESPDAPSPLRIFASGRAWRFVAVALLVGSTWMARNAVLTGNPVYAFFPEIFTKSVRVNPEVLRSAEIEWFRNGDGIGRLAEQRATLRTGIGMDEGSPLFQRRATVGDRIAASWHFWAGFETVRDNPDASVTIGAWSDRLGVLLRGLGTRARVLDYPQAWKMNPLVMGFALPGALLGLALFLRGLREDEPLGAAPAALLGSMALLGGGLLAYKYLLADFYLYQIVPVLVPLSIVAACGAAVIAGMAHGFLRSALLIALGAVLAAAAYVPGIGMAAMNFKFIGSWQEPGGRIWNSVAFDALRNPGMPARLFYRLTFGDDPAMWEYVSRKHPGTRILSHENRHAVYDPTITMVHLDDWAMQQLWGVEDPAALHRALLEQGITLYLRVPNEAKHEVNRRLRMDLLIGAGLATEEFRSGENILYRLAPAGS